MLQLYNADTMLSLKADELTCSLHATADDVQWIGGRLSKQSCHGTTTHLLQWVWVCLPGIVYSQCTNTL